jgi:zinc transport system substrate-binding protein
LPEKLAWEEKVMKKLLGLFIVFTIFIVSCGNGKDAGAGTAEEVSVFTSILPQKFFAQQIGGDRVNVSVLVQPGKSPATYEPTPDQVVELSEADVLFTIGVPFENAFLPKIESSAKEIRIVDTSGGIEKRHLEEHSHGEGDHDEEEEDHHDEEEGAIDPHVWMSPLAAVRISENILNTLVELDPEGEKQYRENFNELKKQLEAVHQELTEILKPYRGSVFFVFHPAFGYFADEYGLRQVAVETGGKSPTPSDLEEIIEHAREEEVKVIFVQPEFPQKSAERIAEAIDGAVVNLNPLNPDYLENLRRIAREVEKGLL